MRPKLLIFVALLLAAGCSNLPAQTQIPVEPTATLPIPTGTELPTPTLEPSPIPSPTPTPIPAVRIEEGEQALLLGDYETAYKEFDVAFREASDDGVRAAALWGLGRTDYIRGYHATAITWLRKVNTDYPDSLEAARSYFIIGRAFDALQRYGEAAEAYTQYLNRRSGVIDAYVFEALGDALANNGDYGNALNAYQNALQSPQMGDGLAIERKIAQMYLNLGSTEQALQVYDEIFNTTGNDYIKAEMDLLAGRAHLLRGETDLANQRFLHTVQAYPLAYDSYSALVSLVEAGIPVSDLDRGLVDYFAGQYGLALNALTRYIESNPPENDGTALHYQALTQRALGYNAEAIASWASLIENYPGNRYWVTAWDEKATTQWAYLGDYTGASQTLLDFVAQAPTAIEAPDYLYTAARIYERDGNLAKAIETWERVANEYAQAENVLESLHQAGIARYRLRDFEGAMVEFQRILLLANEKEDQARASFWVAKCQSAKGDNEAATTTFKQTVAIDPTGYYSERAEDLLSGRQPFDQPLGLSLGVNLAQERPDADTWVRVAFNLPAGTDLNGAGISAQDGRFIRGSEFWEMGLYNEANDEFVSLRESVKGDALASYQLGNALLDMGLYRQAIYAIRNTLTLAGLGEHHESLQVPAYFNHIRYGMYYSDLILPIAKENGFHPLFLYSVIRQESLFDTAARSGAGARGLMQIVPSTGESLARSYGWPLNYNEEDLYRPVVNVRLGTFYLFSNRKALNGDLYAMLAAYNGGPGNASVWQEMAGSDPDLQVELIRFAETRDYIRSIYETYKIYTSLYSPLQ